MDDGSSTRRDLMRACNFTSTRKQQRKAGTGLHYINQPVELVQRNETAVFPVAFPTTLAGARTHHNL